VLVAVSRRNGLFLDSRLREALSHSLLVGYTDITNEENYIARGLLGRPGRGGLSFAIIQLIFFAPSESFVEMILLELLDCR
jgi:hypothetical protein